MFGKLAPLLVMGGIAMHGPTAVKEKIGKLVGSSDTYLTKQRIGVVLRSARLRVAADGELSFKDDKAFRRWVQKSVRIEKIEGADPSLDAWGTPFQHKISARGLTVASAGADKSFNTKDDIAVTANVFDY